jgi:fructose-bisphosphate aldolase class I
LNFFLKIKINCYLYEYKAIKKSILLVKMQSNQTGLNKYKEELMQNAKALCVSGKGILAADESLATNGNQFKAIKVENNEENRRAYRELLFLSEGIENYISGVILFDETLHQSTKSGEKFVDVLKRLKIIPGIKVDKGHVLIGGTNNESATQGLDDLGKRCAKYYEDGARFSKWRALLRIGNDEPSSLAIAENAHGLARYAVISQENGLVPIVECEVLFDGPHDIDECAAKSEKVLSAVIKACQDQGVLFEGALLKPNMITPGFECPKKVSAQEIARKTVRTLLRTIPGAIPGIMFLSGGQCEDDASENLNEINKLDVKRPWNLSFSYGRALQHSCLKAWLGKPENVAEAQRVLLEKAKNNSDATLGKYIEKSSSSGKDSLHTNFYVY